MHQFFKRFTATTLLTTGLGITTLFPALADMGHGEHSSPPPTDMPHGEGGGDHGHHAALEIPADQPIPAVSLEIYPDPVAGWNLEVQTENWTFAPEQVNQTSTTTEGHAHLYLNGEKVTRLYSHWYYLPSLPPGEHTLTVGLNANGHETLMHDGQPIEASITMMVP